MSSRVSVTDLKAKLSHYLREVHRGSEVEILDRGVPIARLVGVARAEGSGEERRARLVRSGVLRQGTAAVPEIVGRPLLQLSTSVLEALAEERADRF